MKTLLNHSIVCALAGFLFAAVGCSDDTPVIQENTGNTETTETPQDSTVVESTEETPDFQELDNIYGIQIMGVSKAAADSLGLYYIDATDDSFTYDPILEKRRLLVDMRPGTADKVTLNLKSPANLRWQLYSTPSFTINVPDNIWYTHGYYGWEERGAKWFYNQCSIDYGYVVATSISPTQIEITRKDNVSADAHPVSIYLERQLIGYIPTEPGNYAKAIVLLSDVPYTINDTYITIEQAQELGLTYIAYDSEEFMAPILEGNQATVELFIVGDSVTIELLSPVSFSYDDASGFGPEYLDTFYQDLYAEYWFYTPMQMQYDNVMLTTTDPYHLTITRLDGYSKSHNFRILLYRGDEVRVPDVHFPVAYLNIVEVEQDAE